MKTSATILVKLSGTSYTSYKAAVTSMTVKPVDKAKALTGAAATVGPTAKNAAATVGSLYVDIKCPVVGTAWVHVWSN